MKKALAESSQLLEKEQNSKTKYEIDYHYMNSLKYTVIIDGEMQSCVAHFIF